MKITLKVLTLKVKLAVNCCQSPAKFPFVVGAISPVLMDCKTLSLMSLNSTFTSGLSLVPMFGASVLSKFRTQ